MKRVLWVLLLALLFGLGLGLVYAWVISPTRIVDSEPIALRADFKDHYRSAIAAAYAGTGNITRARARLSLLGDPNPIEALNAQAQRLIASGEIQQADQVAALASALESGSVTSQSTVQDTGNINTPSGALPTVFASTQTGTPVQVTETPPLVPTQPVILEATPRPTRTAIATLGAPFALTGQESICDSNLPDGLLQVLVLNSNRRQMPGIKIMITWDGGSEQFFTGFKPELGNGYADFIMTPNIIYAVQLGLGSDTASGITSPTCQTPGGDSFSGGIKLTYQQP